MKKSKIIIAIIAIMLITLIIGIVLLTVRNVNTSIVENHQFYQYYEGKKVKYEGTLVLESQNHISKITVGDKKVELDSTPIYYLDMPNKVIFPQNMAVVYPIRNGLMYKINRFEKLQQEKETIYIEKENKNQILENAFLYDGADLYFFLQNTTITVEENEYNVGPLSYAFVEYNGKVEIYDKENDKGIVLEGKNKNVLAKSEDFTINMSIDAIEYGEKQQLLIKNVDTLKNLE